MRKKLIILLVMVVPAQWAWSQQKQTKSDTVIVELGKSSKIVLTVGDSSDLEMLKKYNFQKLFEDVLQKIEDKDTVAIVEQDTATYYSLTTKESKDEYDPWSEDWGNDNNDDNDNKYTDRYNWEYHGSKRYGGRTRHSINFEFGMNNWLEEGEFPDNENALYAIKPWGSWYVGFSSIQRTRMGKKFFLEWGGGISWYNLKFEDPSVRVLKDDTGVKFYLDEDPAHSSFKKSKIAATFINASVVPVLDFGGNGRKPRLWDNHRESFRIGIGPYIGYRIDSWTRAVYREDDDKQKDKNKGNYYINNFRYGARLQIGFRSTDFFVNYDFNEFFAEGRGPNLNAFSFGIIL